MIFPKKTLTLFLIIIVTGALVFFIFLKKGADLSINNSLDSSSNPVQEAEETPLSVKAVTAEKGDLVIKLKSPGEAVSNRKITIIAEVSGVVQALHVQESQHVKKGDLLVELDDREFKLNLERYEADRLRYLSELMLEERFAEPDEKNTPKKNQIIQQSADEYEKKRLLYGQGKITEEEFEEAYRKHEKNLIESGEKKDEIRAAAKGLKQAEIQVKRAKMDLEKTKIHAPYSGIVYDIKVSPQERISTNSELFSLVNIERIQIHATVLESEISKMKKGREVDLRFSAYPEKKFNGKIKAISPIVNPDDKTCKVIIEVRNPDERIKPGMHAEVEIVAEIYENRLLIPQDAVLTREGKRLAFVVQNDLAKWRYIEVGIENEDYAEVINGIEEGELVIVEGHLTLAHDAKVRVIQ